MTGISLNATQGDLLQALWYTDDILFLRAAELTCAPLPIDGMPFNSDL